MAIVATAALPACSPVDILNATIPRGAATVTRDVAYGPLDRQRLDVYRPNAAGAAPPVVVFIYGGSWKTGSRGDYLFVAERLARLGCVAVVPDYRLYPEVRFPTFIEDAARAVAWTQARVADLGGGRVFVMGHSAGAHIAAMVAINPAYLAAAGGDPAKLAGLIGISGPYDFLPITDPDIIPIFAGSDPAVTQPITFVHPGAPPAFLATGDADRTVNPDNTSHLAAALRRVGTRVDERHYAGVGHVGIITAFAPLFSGNAPVADDVGRFIRAVEA